MVHAPETTLSSDDSANPLPSIQTAQDAEAVYGALLKMSKRGKLAGFEHDAGAGSAVADAHGSPFDSDLLIEHAGGESGGEVRFSLKLRTKFPAIFAALLIVSVWPGLPLTDSFMFNFEWYERLMGESIKTWMWYLPLTVLPIPFVWKSAIKKSHKSAQSHAIETIEKIRAVLGS